MPQPANQTSLQGRMARPGRGGVRLGLWGARSSTFVGPVLGVVGVVGVAVLGGSTKALALPVSDLVVLAENQGFAPAIDRRVATLLDTSAPMEDRQAAVNQLLFGQGEQVGEGGEGLEALVWVLDAVSSAGSGFKEAASDPAGLTALAAMATSEAKAPLVGAMTTDDAALSRAFWRSAVAFNGTTRPIVIEALVQLQDAGFRDDVVLPALADANQPLVVRRLACRVLGAWGGTVAMTALAAHIDDADTAVAQAAKAGLDTLVYDAATGADWMVWWADTEQWSDADLSEWLTREQARAALAARRGKTQTTKRLVSAMREAYWALDAGQQSIRLAALITDAMPAVRRLGLEIAELRIGDGEAFDDRLLASLRERLTDHDPALRAQSTRLLTALKDEAAAMATAKRLMARAEQDPAALSAMLQLLARVPQREAVTPAMGLLEHPAVGHDAATFLSAAVDVGYVNDAFARQAVHQVREAIAKQVGFRPEWLTLLAKLGDDNDWAYIETLLDHPNAQVRQAAANVWADDPGRPLVSLARRGSDPSLQPILYAAARANGHTLGGLIELIARRPADDLVPAWFESITAVIGRVPPARAIRAIDEYARAHGEPAKQLLLITSVLDALPSSESRSQADSGVAAQLLFRRAAVRFAQGKLAEALGDLEQVVLENKASGGEMDPAMALSVALTRAQCHFGLDQFEEGITTLDKIEPGRLAEAPGLFPVVEAAAESIVRKLRADLEDAVDFVDTTAGPMLQSLHETLGQAVETETISTALGRVQAQITGATTPADVEAQTETKGTASSDSPVNPSTDPEASTGLNASSTPSTPDQAAPDAAESGPSPGDTAPESSANPEANAGA